MFNEFGKSKRKIVFTAPNVQAAMFMADKINRELHTNLSIKDAIISEHDIAEHGSGFEYIVYDEIIRGFPIEHIKRHAEVVSKLRGMANAGMAKVIHLKKK